MTTQSIEGGLFNQSPTTFSPTKGPANGIYGCNLIHGAIFWPIGYRPTKTYTGHGTRARSFLSVIIPPRASFQTHVYNERIGALSLICSTFNMNKLAENGSRPEDISGECRKCIQSWVQSDRGVNPILGETMIGFLFRPHAGVIHAVKGKYFRRSPSMGDLLSGIIVLNARLLAALLGCTLYAVLRC